MIPLALSPDAVRRRRRIAGACLVAAPLVMLAADTTGLIRGDAAFWPVSILLFVSFIFFVPAIVGMSALAAHGSDRLGLTGAGLSLVGLLTGVSILGVYRALYVALGSAHMPDVLSPEGQETLLASTFQTGILFPIGLIVLAVALRRAGALSTAAAALMALGAVLFPVGRIIVGFPASVASDVCLSLALVPLGVSLRAGAARAPAIESAARAA